jgi:hypothetical protein
VTVADAWKIVTTLSSARSGAIHSNTKQGTQAIFENWVTFKALPVALVTEQHRLAVIDAATDTGKPGIAKGLRSFCGTFYLMKPVSEKRWQDHQ